MFCDLNEFKQKMKGKEVAVVGIGVSNTPLIRLLVKYGASVTACDKKLREQLGERAEELKQLGVRLCLGENYLEDLKGDYLFKTPGMRYDLPELLAFEKEGGEVLSEMEVFFEICPCKKIAVTGSDGKTTTTSLIFEMMSRAGYICHLGGNIGKPLLPEIETIKASDYAILELSSFQLHTMKISPQIAVITNIEPNHLDVHKSMEEYIEAKQNICRFQEKTDRLVVNFSNDITRETGEKAAAQVTCFSRYSWLDKGVCYRDGYIYKDGEKILNTEDIRLPGMHNVENYMTAIAAVWGLVPLDTIEDVAKHFAGIPHRIEFVRERNGVRFYNDSIASSPTRAMACLNAFYEKGTKIVMIAGGYDKKIPFDNLGKEITKKVKKLFLVGNTSKKIADAVLQNDPNFPIEFCQSLEEAVRASCAFSTKGDVVALCPACASFDLFPNFEVRGNTFKQLVNAL